MRVDGEATRVRVLQAARAEFAQFGLAGARIDRIARTAQASKERLYAYYRDKRELFVAVLELNLREFSEAVLMDGMRLPESAGALYEHSVEHPEHLRMLDWARLEGDAGLRPSEAASEHERRQLETITAAQARGAIDAGWDARELMTLVFGIATAWTHDPSLAFFDPKRADAATRARRRAAVEHSVAALVAAPPPVPAPAP